MFVPYGEDPEADLKWFNEVYRPDLENAIRRALAEVAEKWVADQERRLNG